MSHGKTWALVRAEAATCGALWRKAFFIVWSIATAGLTLIGLCNDVRAAEIPALLLYSAACTIVAAALAALAAPIFWLTRGRILVPLLVLPVATAAAWLIFRAPIGRAAMTVLTSPCAVNHAAEHAGGPGAVIVIFVYLLQLAACAPWQVLAVLAWLWAFIACALGPALAVSLVAVAGGVIAHARARLGARGDRR